MRWIGVVAITVACSAAPPPRRPTAPGFELALASFRDFTAAALHVSPRDVDVGPTDERIAKLVKQNVGRAWAFDSTLKREPATGIRGWALPDGTVITAKQNLGRMFEEAGIWGATTTATGDELAARVVWSLGWSTWLIETPAPSLTVEPDGSGVLTFRAGYRWPPGPGARERRYAGTVTLGSDRTARLEMREDPSF
jgi:hypothetical protein